MKASISIQDAEGIKNGSGVLLKNSQRRHHDLQVINLEWGNFRSPWLPRTFADEEVDNESVNPGDQVSTLLHESFSQDSAFTSLE